MDISIFFSPISDKLEIKEGKFGDRINVYNSENKFPELENIQLAIIGVEEDRNSVHNEGACKAPFFVREKLYSFSFNGLSANIADLGNIKQGNTPEDTYYALSNSVEHLVKKNILPIIIGGSQDLTFANYSAYQQLEQTVNLVSIDKQFDLGSSKDEITDNSYLSKVILHQPNFLFNYSNIGYQSYFVNEEAIDLMDKLFFDTYRLGSFLQNIQESEPIIRNADVISFDVGAVRMSDAPGTGNPTVNGFYAEQACQMARYAGLSDKLSSIGFYNYVPHKDVNGQTAGLMAQLIWFVAEGFTNRRSDFPVRNKKSFVKYRVMLEDNKYELQFYKSMKTDRWWIDVPYPPNKRMRFERHHLVPCSYNAYQRALEDEMPDCWWKTYQKLV